MSLLLPAGGATVTAPGPVVITQTDLELFTPNASVFTYTGVDIGTATSDRIVMIVTSSDRDGGNATATIDGDAMTVWYERTGPLVGFLYRAVPTGTTATIVVTLPATVGDNQIGVYAITGASTTLHDTANDRPSSGSAPSTTIDVAAAGGVIASSFVDYSAYTWSWTGLTEDYDHTAGSSNTAGAHDEFAAAETGRTITATPSSLTSNNLSLMVISLAPV